MKLPRLIISFLIVVLCASCSDQDSSSLKIATAANMQYAMRALSEQFTRETGIATDLIISSSGQLTSQIKAGAPFDIFVAADIKYPQEIYDNGRSPAPPEIYAYGSLVLWSTLDINPSIDLLTRESIKRIAVANPKTAPYGEAAIEVLEHYKLLDKLKPKLIYGTSIAQTNQFITSQAAEVGFTAKAVVVAPSLQNKGSWAPVASESYTPIAQGIVQIDRGEDTNEGANAFYTYMFSPSAKKILEQYGYTTDSL